MIDVEPRLAWPVRAPWFSRVAGLLAIVLVAHGLRATGFLERTFNEDAGQDWQWDFESYYYAVQADRAGGSPYDDDALVRLAGHSVYPFAYPPHTLAFFALFDRGDLVSSKWLFLGIKLAVVAATMALWTLGLIAPGRRGWFLAFAALGFNATIARDITAGNVCAFEQLPLWIGILALLHGRTAVFCLMVLLAAQFKVQPLALLGLMWFQPTPRRWTYLTVTLAAMVLIFAGMAVHDPQTMRQYLHHSTQLAEGESGLGNPSALRLWTELMMMILGPYDVFEAVSRRQAALAVYPLFAIAILVLTFRALPADRRDRCWLYLGVVTYALVAPRMKDYSWSLVLVPAFELLRRILRRPRTAAPLILLTAVIFALPLRDSLWIYRPYLLTFMLWAATIFAKADGEARPAAALSGALQRAHCDRTASADSSSHGQETDI